MNRCRSCVIPDARPDTLFEDGVCSACRSFANRGRVDWSAREEEFHTLMRSKHHPVSGYDCIVASSGGKDSHWQVLKVLELGYRPLVVTASTCMLTPIGRFNIDNLARYADTIEVTPNRQVRAKLNRLGLELVGDISWPEHATIFNTPWSIARSMLIPLVLYGENPQEAYGGPQGTTDARAMTRRWVTEFGGFLGLRAQDLVGQKGLTERDLHPYRPLDERLVAAAGIEAYFMGAYFRWDAERNARLAADHGMRQHLPTPANWWLAENLDNAMTGLHDHAMYRKYGYGRAAAQLSVDIRHNRISRDEAMRNVREIDGLFPEVYAGVSFRAVLEQIRMSEGELMDQLARFTNRDLFERPYDKRPILKEFA
jgi:N-acetyl sugar amidotransferase